MIKKKKTLRILGVIFLQCLILAGICFQREIIVKKGDVVFMRTAPIDPRDLFRGDYVRLEYDVSNLASKLAPGREVETMRLPEKKVYVIFETDPEGVMIPVSVSLKKPCKGKFIKGYTKKSWQNDRISVRFGIEKYFVQQKKGFILEKGEFIEGVRIPLEMKVALGKKNGVPVLIGYRYGAMGMEIQLPRNRPQDEDISFKIIIKVANASDKPLAIVDPEDHSTFRITISHNRYYGNEAKIRFKEYPTTSICCQESDIKLIKPKSVYTFELDLAQPEYQLLRGKKEVTWRDMKWGEQARIIYTSPDRSKLSGLKNADYLWQGQLTSRSFTGFNFTD